MKLFLYILLGLLIGLIDALPMFKRKVPVFSIAAIWLQWVFIALAVAYFPVSEPVVFRGTFFGFLGMLPFQIQLFYRNRAAIPGSVIASLVLGSLLGLAVGSV
ncbi:MAG: hypothetical protein RLZZ370_1018 [Bacteroidota bacterium]|jgi:hypothetical protein